MRPPALASRGEVKTAPQRRTSMPSRASTSAVSVAAIVLTARRTAAIASGKLAPRAAASNVASVSSSIPNACPVA